MSDDATEISEALDLETWLENEGIAFKAVQGRSGRQLQLLECPSCGKRENKVYLNAETGIGNCFSGSCETGFNKLKFIHIQTGLSWRETFEHCRQFLKEQGWRPRKMVTAAVEQEKATLPDSFALPTEDGSNLQYLEDRGITGELAKHFHFRFCERGWWNFTRQDGSKGGQKFDMRVIIPVYDLDGTFVTFQGRDITGESESKYLFPAGLPGTGRFVYNGQNCVNVKRMVLCEGVMDVAAAKIAFDEDVALRGVTCCGSFGKHLSYGDLNGDDQLGRILKLKGFGLQEITLMWDGEASALVAALDAAKRIKSLGLSVRIAMLPAGKDPNEVQGAVVREAFYKAQPYTTLLDVKYRIRNPYPVHQH
jgi:DNA primase